MKSVVIITYSIPCSKMPYCSQEWPPPRGQYWREGHWYHWAYGSRSTLYIWDVWPFLRSCCPGLWLVGTRFVSLSGWCRWQAFASLIGLFRCGRWSLPGRSCCSVWTWWHVWSSSIFWRSRRRHPCFHWVRSCWCRRRGSCGNVGARSLFSEVIVPEGISLECSERLCQFSILVSFQYTRKLSYSCQE